MTDPVYIGMMLDITLKKEEKKDKLINLILQILQ